jgi:hypothetical protein
MKKLLVTLLILGIAAGAFAQFTAQVTADFNPEIMRITSPTGDSAKKEVPQSAGTFDLLSSSGNDSLGQTNQLRVRFQWGNAENAFLARVVFAADRLVRAYSGATGVMAPGADANPNGAGNHGLDNIGGDMAGHSFVNGTGKTPNMGDLLASSLDGWFVEGRASIFTAVVGSTSSVGTIQRGQASAFNFQNFNDYVSKVKVDNFGILTPSVLTPGIGSFYVPAAPGTPPPAYVAFASVNDQDNTNIGKRMNTEGAYGNQDMPFWSLSLNFNDLINLPLIFQVFGDIGYNGFGSASTDLNTTFATRAPVINYSRFNGGFRVSGAKLADLVTFDAMYRIRGGDENTYDNNDMPTGREPDGVGVTAHTFGLYTSWHMFPVLGITFGYTGQFRTYEDFKTTTAATQTYSGPMYHGVDLRFQFKGVDKLTITLNNNFSIAFADGVNASGNKYVVGLLGRLPAAGLTAPAANNDILADKQEQRWLALYNGLGFKYALSPTLTLDLMLGNRLGMFKNYMGSTDTNSESTVDTLGAAVSATYQFNTYVQLAAGLEFLYNMGTFTYTLPNTTETYDYGMASFAVPLRLRVVY